MGSSDIRESCGREIGVKSFDPLELQIRAIAGGAGKQIIDEKSSVDEQEISAATSRMMR